MAGGCGGDEATPAKATPSTVECPDDGNPCTDERVVDRACTHPPRAAACDDGDACTASDTCQSGQCVGTAVKCDDDNPCTDDACDATSGCEAEPNDADCDDNDACTTGDTCAAASCAGGGAPAMR